MRTVRLIGVPIVIALLLVAACAPKTLSPAGQKAYTAGAIATRIAEFQRVVISASDAKQMPVETARTLVTWCVSALETLKATPQGWETTVRTGWLGVRPTALKFPALSGWAVAIDLLLGVQS